MKWEESLRKQATSLSYTIDYLMLNGQMEKVIQAISTTKGIVYFTGVGKNMYTAARVSDTYQSLGIRSLFIDPVNSLHGGMGVFSPIDTVVAISKSGETEELIKFLTVLSRRDFENIIAISSSESSSLARLAKFSLIVPVRDEGDHLGLAPISSTMIYGAVLDSIAVEISSERGYSRLDFIENHPGGELGKTRG